MRQAAQPLPKQWQAPRWLVVRWHRAIVTAMLPAVLVVLLGAGCGTAQPGPYRATVGSCFAFGVQAIRQRLIVTKVPPACAGLSHGQVNLALARAVREAVGPRPKVAGRQSAERAGEYLKDLFTTVPPPLPEPLAAAPQQPSGDRPLQLAALGAWVATAAAGGYLLAGWVAGAGRRRSGRGARPPGVLMAHAGLAIAGLALWTTFLAADAAALAWLAVGVILVVAGLGMATLITGLPDPQAGAPAGSRAAVLVIAVHGALATAAILLVLLGAVGAG
jgi:hypothetical protein